MKNCFVCLFFEMEEEVNCAGELLLKGWRALRQCSLAWSALEGMLVWQKETSSRPPTAHCLGLSFANYKKFSLNTWFLAHLKRNYIQREHHSMILENWRWSQRGHWIRRYCLLLQSNPTFPDRRTMYIFATGNKNRFLNKFYFDTFGQAYEE